MVVRIGRSILADRIIEKEEKEEMKIPEIIKKIEDNVGMTILDHGKYTFRTIGGRRYIAINTKYGTREFR